MGCSRALTNRIGLSINLDKFMFIIIKCRDRSTSMLRKPALEGVQEYVYLAQNIQLIRSNFWAGQQLRQVIIFLGHSSLRLLITCGPDLYFAEAWMEWTTCNLYWLGNGNVLTLLNWYLVGVSSFVFLSV